MIKFIENFQKLHKERLESVSCQTLFMALSFRVRLRRATVYPEIDESVPSGHHRRQMSYHATSGAT